jgi:hypothetical protein
MVGNFRWVQILVTFAVFKSKLLCAHVGATIDLRPKAPQTVAAASNHNNLNSEGNPHSHTVIIPYALLIGGFVNVPVRIKKSNITSGVDLYDNLDHQKLRYFFTGKTQTLT